jgi:hypothetical protein
MPVLKRLSLVSLGTRAVLWMLASSLGAVAMGQETEADDIPPERVARLVAQGGVSLQAVGETEWAAAPVNRPIVPGDYLRTEWDGRAELQVGEAAIRLGSGTGFTFVAFDERALRMRVTSGVVNLRVRELGESDVIEVETPQAVALSLRPGNYRLEVNANGGATVVKVSSAPRHAAVPTRARRARPAGRNAHRHRAPRVQHRHAGAPIHSTSGRWTRSAHRARGRQTPRSTFRATSSAMKTWTATARGARSRNTAMCGRPHASLPAGLHTAMGVTPIFPAGAGRGSTMRRGALLRFTTATGSPSAVAGAGCRARGMWGGPSAGRAIRTAGAYLQRPAARPCATFRAGD